MDPRMQLDKGKWHQDFLLSFENSNQMWLCTHMTYEPQAKSRRNPFSSVDTTVNPYGIFWFFLAFRNLTKERLHSNVTTRKGTTQKWKWKCNQDGRRSICLVRRARTEPGPGYIYIQSEPFRLLAESQHRHQDYSKSWGLGSLPSAVQGNKLDWLQHQQRRVSSISCLCMMA